MFTFNLIFYVTFFAIRPVQYDKKRVYKIRLVFDISLHLNVLYNHYTILEKQGQGKA